MPRSSEASLRLPLKIYPITDTRIVKLSHTEQVVKLIEGGAEFIQLREKFLSPKKFYEDALEAIKIARGENVKIIINDRVDIALALKADGVHLGQDDLSPIAARQILGENALIGFSTHNLQQISEAVRLPIDYAAIGPVFTTTTKENSDATVGIEIVKKARKISAVRTWFARDRSEEARRDLRGRAEDARRRCGGSLAAESEFPDGLPQQDRQPRQQRARIERQPGTSIDQIGLNVRRPKDIRRWTSSCSWPGA